MDPSIFFIINEEAEWEKACCITCMAIKPGARKLINVTPNTLPLMPPKANERTSKKSNEVTIGETIV